MKKMKRTNIAMAVAIAAIAVSVSIPAQAMESSSPDKQSTSATNAIGVKPDSSLVEYQKRLAKIEQKMELMRQQNALLLAKINRIQVQRQYEQVVSGGLPGVLTVFKSGGEMKARVRYQTGIERVVSVGDPLNKQAVVGDIDEKAGVIAKVGRKKIVLDYISRDSASSAEAAVTGNSSSAGGATAGSSSSTLPSPIMPPPPPSVFAPMSIR